MQGCFGANALRIAHNGKNRAALDAAFREADQTLIAQKIGDAAQREFWAKVDKAASAGQWLVEKQANSSLVALMQAIQNGLALRKAKT